MTCDDELPDPTELRGILGGGPTLEQIRGDRTEELRTELLTACIECHEYRDLFRRCMELVERYETKRVQSVDGESNE